MGLAERCIPVLLERDELFRPFQELTEEEKGRERYFILNLHPGDFRGCGPPVPVENEAGSTLEDRSSSSYAMLQTLIRMLKKRSCRSAARIQIFSETILR